MERLKPRFNVSPTRCFVDAFAEQMENKLAENRHKGDAAGWRGMTIDQLQARLFEEAHELIVAIQTGQSPDAVIREAADVGNFAMMIADAAKEGFKN